MKFDFFVAKLQCNNCRKVSNDDFGTNMQTKIQENESCGQSLKVGTKLKIQNKKLEEHCYQKINNNQSNENSFIIIEQWDCPFCNSALNWARIVISNLTIIEIKSIELNPVEISNTNYIFEDYQASKRQN
jgi:hypothetical protein